MSVWILVFYMAGFQAGGPAVIDNIASQEECVRVQKIVRDLRGHNTSARCIEVRKVPR